GDRALLDRVTVRHYEAGHMMYTHKPSLRKLKDDLAAFLEGGKQGPRPAIRNTDRKKQQARATNPRRRLPDGSASRSGRAGGAAGRRSGLVPGGRPGTPALVGVSALSAAVLLSAHRPLGTVADAHGPSGGAGPRPPSRPVVGPSEHRRRQLLG